MATYESYALTSLRDSALNIQLGRHGGQLFTATDDHTITAVDIWAYKELGTTGNVALEIRNVAVSVPGSTVYASSQAVASAWTTAYGWRTVEITAAPIISNTQQWSIVVKISTAPSLSGIYWGNDATTPLYTVGHYTYKAIYSTAWLIDFNRDFLFIIYGSAIAAGSIVPFAVNITGESSVSINVSELMALVANVESVSITTTDLRLIIGYYTAIYGIGSLVTTLELVTAAIVTLATSIYATAEVSAALRKLASLINILSSTQVNPLFATDSFDSFLVGGDTEIQDNAYAPLIEALLRFSLGSQSGIDRVLTGSAGTVITLKGGMVVGLS